MSNGESRSIDVFVHVPKTAGTTLRSFVINRYGSEHARVFHGRTGLLSPAREAIDYTQEDAHRMSLLRVMAANAIYALPPSAHEAALRIRNRVSSKGSQDSLHDTANAIVGHFALDHLENTFGTNTATRNFTLVREPLDRMISHYNYGRQLKLNRQALVGWTEGQNFNQSFEDFALGEGLQDFQTQFTGNDPDRYEHIGTTEDVKGFLKKVGLADKDEDVPHYNKTRIFSQIDRSTLSTTFLDEFEEAHKTDYEFYNSVTAKNEQDIQSAQS